MKKHRLRVTLPQKVDVSRKALIELDGSPAADVDSAELGIPRDKIVDNVLVNPMGRAVGNQVFISSMNGMDTDGTLTNYKRINKNDCIYFLSLGDYKATEQQTRQQIQQDASHISLVLSIDCIYRYLLYEKEGYFSTYAKDMASLGPHLGIVGGGEQYNNQHVKTRRWSAWYLNRRNFLCLEKENHRSRNTCSTGFQ